MKAGYIKPTIEFEDFELNTAIAAGCTVIVDFGPDSTKVCTGYDPNPFAVKPGIDTMADEINQPFADSTQCSCYVSSSGGAIITS